MSNDKLFELLPLIKLDDFISLDLETTGLDHSNDKITEISACRFVSGKFCEEFTTLINPEVLIPNNIVSITGITNQMVSKAPIISEVMSDIHDFIGSLPIVGHNVNFDYKFLNNISKTIFKNNCLFDTLALSRTFLYHYNSFSLSSLCEHYNIKVENAHRAKVDALNTGKLFLYLIQEVASRPLYLIEKNKQYCTAQ